MQPMAWLFRVGLIMLILGCQGTESRTGRDPRPVCDLGVASIRCPAGWTAQRSEWPTAALFVPEGIPRELSSQLISVDICSTRDSDAGESAKAFALKWQGFVQPTTTTVAGQKAYWVECLPPAGQLQPRLVAVFHHGEYVFYLIAGASDRSDLKPDLEEIIESWDWY